MPREPQYRHHKSWNLAYITVDGRQVYLGKYNSPESKDRYEEELLKWRKRHDLSAKNSTTVGQLCLAFIRHADQLYRDKEGQPTREADNFRQSIRPLVQLYRYVPCAEFGPRRLKEVQAELARKHVLVQANRHLSRIKSVFRWGVAEEMVPAEIVTALECVRGLQSGRGQARESEPVQPVPDHDLTITIPHLSHPVRGIVRVLELTGARVSEIRLMRVGDIETSGEVWIYRPGSHKNAWRGKKRTIFIGPQAQQILTSYIGDAVRRTQFVFRPKETINRPYTLTGLLSSIRKGCAKAKVPAWSPGQLRHNAATNINRIYGDIDAARVVLGHGEKRTTEIYAEKDLEKAAEIAKRIG